MIRLDTVESDFGTIKILKRRSTGAVVYEQGGFCQSEADSNGTSLASYIHAIFGLISQTGARKTLLIGCGGGTLATMLRHAGHAVTMIDVDPASFAIARRYFELPGDVACQVADAKSFLRSDPNKYDAIVLDAFHGDCIPAHLRSLRFFCMVRERLSRDGSAFANVHVKHNLDHHADRIANSMACVFPHVRLLDSGVFGERNAIVMAGAVLNLRPPGLIVAPMADRGVIESELAAMTFRARRQVSTAPWYQ